MQNDTARPDGRRRTTVPKVTVSRSVIPHGTLLSITRWTATLEADRAAKRFHPQCSVVLGVQPHVLLDDGTDGGATTLRSRGTVSLLCNARWPSD